jgi:hypothetical protein
MNTDARFRGLTINIKFRETSGYQKSISYLSQDCLWIFLNQICMTSGSIFSAIETRQSSQRTCHSFAVFRNVTQSFDRSEILLLFLSLFSFHFDLSLLFLSGLWRKSLPSFSRRSADLSIFLCHSTRLRIGPENFSEHPWIRQMTLICLFRFHSTNGPEINYGLSQPEGLVRARHPPWYCAYPRDRWS